MAQLTAFQSINASRVTVLRSLVGQQVELLLNSSNPTEMEVKNSKGESVPDAQTGAVLYKKIYNTNAKSEVACKSGYSKKLDKSVADLQTAIIKQLPSMSAQDEMTEEQRAYLNATAFTFSLLNNHPLYNSLNKGMIIIGEVEERTTENGSILTLNPKTVAIKPATVLKKSADPFATALTVDADAAAPVVLADAIIEG